MEQKHITEEEVRCFVGPNSDYYIQAWSKYLSDDNESLGNELNLGGFFMGTIWLVYRKMYGIAIAITICSVITVELLAVLAPKLSDFPLAIILGGIVGTYGNKWYYNHVQKQVYLARRRGITGSDLAIVLKRKGGVNWLATIVLCILFPLIAFFAYR